MIIYFKGTRGIFGIHLGEKMDRSTIKGNFQKNLKVMEFIDGKNEFFKVSREHA